MKKLSRLLVVASVAGILLGALGYYITRDAPPPQDDDLRVRRLDIPDEQNGYHDFSLAAERLDWPDDEQAEDGLFAMLDGEEWDEAVVSDLLERNREAFECLQEGLGHPHCQVPENKDFDYDADYLTAWRRLARLCSLRALWLRKQGREREAADQALGIVRFGQMIQACKGTLFHWLVGVGVKGIGLERLQENVAETTLDPAALTQYAGSLGQYMADEQGLADALRVEYGTMAQLVDDMASGRYSAGDVMGAGTPAISLAHAGFLFQPNKTKTIFARTYRVHVKNVSRTYAERDSSDLPQSPDSSGFLWKTRLFLSGNVIGHTVGAMVLPAPERTHQEKCRANVRVRVTQLILALRAYERRTGGLPESLEQLVPDYLDGVPLDDFDGKPIRYSREKRIVYSVGEDLEDSGGSEEEGAWLAEDPTFGF